MLEVCIHIWKHSSTLTVRNKQPYTTKTCDEPMMFTTKKQCYSSNHDFLIKTQGENKR